MNIEILGISELKWTGMGNSHDHYIYYCGQESLRRNEVALIVNKRVRNAVLGCSLKNDRMTCLFPRQTIQYHSNPFYTPTTNAEEAEVEWFCHDLQDLIDLTAIHIYIHVYMYAAATAAKSLQFYPTLCDPIDGSPPGSPILGILQARILEWVIISFSNA